MCKVIDMKEWLIKNRKPIPVDILPVDYTYDDDLMLFYPDEEDCDVDLGTIMDEMGY